MIPTLETKCVVTSDLLRWYEDGDMPIKLLLKLGEDAEIIYVSEKRGTVIVKGLETGIAIGGVPFDIVEKMRVKR